MLSYQHAYHAGNAADVHKHLALVMLLGHLRRKDKPFSYVDSHAGRGIYDLDGAEARRTGEAATGILRLAAAAGAPAPVRDYLGLVAGFNKPGRLRYYPGSAALARALLRADDRAILLELHPRELEALKRSIGGDERVSIHSRGCYEGLPALLPPPIRRGLVLIDPSYEVKNEYEDLAGLLGKATGRWANGIYLLWYPLLAEARHRRLLGRLEALALPRTLMSEHRFGARVTGLQGSGLVVVNAPWRFDAELGAAMRHVAAALDVDGSGAAEQRWLGPNREEDPGPPGAPRTRGPSMPA
jgi:23S rRNA (adenine2030-N6)-methyltransferase